MIKRTLSCSFKCGGNEEKQSCLPILGILKRAVTCFLRCRLSETKNQNGVVETRV